MNNSLDRLLSFSKVLNLPLSAVSITQTVGFGSWRSVSYKFSAQCLQHL